MPRKKYNAATGATIKAPLISKLAAPHAIVALDGFLFIATGNASAIAPMARLAPVQPLSLDDSFPTLT